MGVTIHFEGKLKDDRALAGALTLAKKFSEEHSWSLQPIDEPQVTLRRVRNEENWDYVGPVKGLEIQPKENSEPFRLEFDSDLYVQEYTKTQFAPLEIHVQLVELLHLLQPFFEELRIEDEGEYFESGDLTLLAKHRDRCSEVLNDYLAQPTKYHGPVRIEGGRIVDLMEHD
jgi:hypothetical protein